MPSGCSRRRRRRRRRVLPITSAAAHNCWRQVCWLCSRFCLLCAALVVAELLSAQRAALHAAAGGKSVGWACGSASAP